MLGTAALEEPALAGRSARRWPGRVAVGLDYRVGADGVAEAQAQGWLAGTRQSVTDLLELWQHDPVGAVVATSVARDGMLSGPDLAGLQALLEATALPVVASGGVSDLGDLVARLCSSRRPPAVRRNSGQGDRGRALQRGGGDRVCAASE